MDENSKIGNAQSAAKNAIRDLPDTVEVALIVFSDCEKIEVAQPFTTDKQEISAKIDQIKPFGSTPLVDAIDFANDYKKKAGSNDRTIVLFTDGIETCR
jgi:Mg-chelatase subunit ChlD